MLHQLQRAGFDLVGKRLDEVGAGERVDGVGDPRLVGEHLLGAQGDPRGALGGQGQRLVEAVGVQGLGAAGDGGEALQGDADDVDLGLLGLQGHPAGLGVEADLHRVGVPGPEPLRDDLRPHPPHRAELGDLLEDVVVAVEEEGEARRELVDREASLQRRFDVGDRVGEREGDLLDGRAALLADVVAGDRDRVPFRHVLPAVLEDVGGQAHGRLGRVDVVAARHVLLEDVVLDRAAQLLGGDALLLADQLVEQQQDRRRSVDRHRRGDAVEGDLLEADPHVLDRVDRDPGAADLAVAERVVGVAAELGRQVKGHREAGRAVLDQVAVALVGVFGRGEAGVLAHRPEPVAIHPLVNAAGEGRVPGLAQALLEAGGDVVAGVEALDLDPGVCEDPLVLGADQGGNRAGDLPSAAVFALSRHLPQDIEARRCRGLSPC